VADEAHRSGSGLLLRPGPSSCPYSPECVEGNSLLKNSLGSRFHITWGMKYAVLGRFRAPFVVATSSMPTFSTRW
jgi:hypothetical protein